MSDGTSVYFLLFIPLCFSGCVRVCVCQGEGLGGRENVEEGSWPL